MEAFANYVVGLPAELKAALALLVLAGLRLLLAGRVPESWLTELAAVVTTFVITVIELALGLIPPEFEAIAVSVLQLIAVLLGGVLTLRLYYIARTSARAQGFKV